MCPIMPKRMLLRFGDSAQPGQSSFLQYESRVVYVGWRISKSGKYLSKAFRQGRFPAEQMYEAAQAYDSLHVMDSAAYFYRRALTAYREELDMLKNDTLSFEYEKAVSRIGRLEAMPGISE